MAIKCSLKHVYSVGVSNGHPTVYWNDFDAALDKLIECGDDVVVTHPDESGCHFEEDRLFQWANYRTIGATHIEHLYPEASGDPWTPGLNAEMDRYKRDGLVNPQD